MSKNILPSKTTGYWKVYHTDSKTGLETDTVWFKGYFNDLTPIGYHYEHENTIIRHIFYIR